MKYTLFHLPAVALRVDGKYVNHIYRRIMPPSLPRIAQFLQEDAHCLYNGMEVAGILDLRSLDPDHHTPYKEFEWEGMTVTCERVGGAFELADEAIRGANVIGLSAHFKMERQVVRDFIAYAKRVNPLVEFWVGGADATAEPEAYRHFGADVYVGDLDELPHLTHPAFEFLGELGRYTEGHDGPLPTGVEGPVAPVQFTRGCVRECGFCESRCSRYTPLKLEQCLDMLRHYQRFGIHTLDVVDDNLLLQVGNKDGRLLLLSLFSHMAETGWSWNFPNGLEIGQLMRHGGLDLELVSALFWNTQEGDRHHGCFRVYVPVETWDDRRRFRKLRAVDEQTEVIRAIAGEKVPHLSFGTIVFPNATLETFTGIKSGYEGIRRVVRETSGGQSAVRLGVFNVIPIASYRNMEVAYAHPELWNFYTPAYHGATFTARQLFEARQKLAEELDPVGSAALAAGCYRYQP